MMVKVEIADCAGFCVGVTRAYNIAQKIEGEVFMLGNLVHNDAVIEKLKNQGIKSVKNIAGVKSGTLLISAHGVPPEIYKEAQDKGLRIIDTTCSWVKRVQKLAKESVGSGYQLIIIGDKNHPEVKGIIGWSENKGIVISNPEDVESIKLGDKVAVVAQTTQSEKNFNEVVSLINARVKNVIVHNTICGATEKRQQAAVRLAKKVDLILVIGDIKSANTKRLTELCIKTGTATRQIQTREEFIK